MSDNTLPAFKQIILARYCSEFLHADIHDATVRKTSQDIVMDLRPMAEFTTNEVASHLVANGYTIGFDGDNPAWLMKTENRFELHT